jgi:hypothetical protein
MREREAEREMGERERGGVKKREGEKRREREMIERDRERE